MIIAFVFVVVMLFMLVIARNMMNFSQFVALFYLILDSNIILLHNLLLKRINLLPASQGAWYTIDIHTVISRKIAFKI